MKLALSGVQECSEQSNVAELAKTAHGESSLK